MIDLHTHILPDWDDGARTWEDSRSMCEVAKACKIEMIGLTPHIYRMTKYGDDFSLLNERMNDFFERFEGYDLKVVRGAEVFIHHEIKGIAKDRKLTINGGSYIFIEFPANSFLPGVRDFVYDLILGGLIPIISHPERNVNFCLHPNILYDLIRMGCFGQITAMSLTGDFGPEVKRNGELFLKSNLVHIIASDAHDVERRPPKLAQAVKAAAAIIGIQKAKAMTKEIPLAVVNDDIIPDWGEPKNPVKQKKYLIKAIRNKFPI